MRTSDVHIPGSVSLLSDLHFSERRWADAERVLREGHQAQAARESRAGRAGPDVGGAVMLMADACVKAADAERIVLWLRERRHGQALQVHRLRVGSPPCAMRRSTPAKLGIARYGGWQSYWPGRAL